jgi:hypothetical protein
MYTKRWTNLFVATLIFAAPPVYVVGEEGEANPAPEGSAMTSPEGEPPESKTTNVETPDQGGGLHSAFEDAPAPHAADTATTDNLSDDIVSPVPMEGASERPQSDQLSDDLSETNDVAIQETNSAPASGAADDSDGPATNDQIVADTALHVVDKGIDSAAGKLESELAEEAVPGTGMALSIASAATTMGKAMVVANDYSSSLDATFDYMDGKISEKQFEVAIGENNRQMGDATENLDLKQLGESQVREAVQPPDKSDATTRDPTSDQFLDEFRRSILKSISQETENPNADQTP